MLSAEKFSILVVEDEQPHALLVKRAFEQDGASFNLKLAGSLEEARRWLEANQPALVVTDLVLGDGSGFELLPGSLEAARVPVVVMTSQGDEHKAVEAMKSGALEYVVKSAQTLGDLPRIASRALREWEHLTGKRAAEVALRDSEMRFRRLFEQSYDAIFIHHLDGHLLNANSRACDMLAASERELLSMNFYELPAEQEREPVREALRELNKSGEKRFECVFVRRDGSTLVVDLSSKVIDPEKSLVQSIARDITRRKWSETTLKYRLEVEQLIAGISTQMISLDSLDIQSGMAQAFERLVEFCQVDQGLIYSCQDKDGGLTCLHQWSSGGIQPEPSPIAALPPAKFSEWLACLQTRDQLFETHAFDLLSGDCGPLDTPYQGLIGTLMFVPLSFNERLIGFLELDTLVRQRRWSEEDRLLLKTVAAVFMHALERQRIERHLEGLATHDALTRLPNRRLFQDRLEQGLAHARRHRHMMAVLFIDLDGFKNVNDTYGHLNGDQLLVVVAGRLAESVRAEDTVARLGGDEFAMIINSVQAMEEIELVARRVMSCFEAPFRFHEYQAVVTASLGISVFPFDAEDSRTLLQHADTAMYRSKGAGRNCYSFF